MFLSSQRPNFEIAASATRFPLSHQCALYYMYIREVIKMRRFPLPIPRATLELYLALLFRSLVSCLSAADGAPMVGNRA